MEKILIEKKIMKIQKFKIIIMEIVLVITLISVFILSFLSVPVLGGIGGNVTVITLLQITNAPPEVYNVTVNEGSSVVLIPNSTKVVVCEAIIKDYNNESFLQNVSAVLFNSTLGSAQDNNDYYINDSCTITTNFGSWRGISDDNFSALANCTFNFYYYSNPGRWNCTLNVTSTLGLNATGSGAGNVSELLAVGLPNSINYGLINSTYVSDEQYANVSNYGNVKINLSLDGYGANRYDNISMNCTLGAQRNISIQYEKYNLTSSNPGPLSLSQIEQIYSNLSGVPTVRKFNLDYKTNDLGPDVANLTYWRIYVPAGVAGSCQGNIVFGATKATGI